MASLRIIHDEEKAKRWDSAGTDMEAGQGINDIDAIQSYTPKEDKSLYARLQAFAGQYGVEQRGIERVPSGQRTDSSMSQVGTLVRIL